MAVTRLSVHYALCALVCAVFLLAPSGVATAKDNDPVVARANGVEIHESDLAYAEQGIGGDMRNMMPSQQKRTYLINYLIDMVVLTQAAEQQKVGERPDVKHWLTFDHNRRLMESLLQDASRAALSDQAEHTSYNEFVKQMKNGEEEVHARHILVATEDEAKEILAELKGGADFATLAKEKSKDRKSAAVGGDLGYFTKDQMVPEFGRDAFTLEKGQISEPVKTEFGWHIIKVEDRRIKPTPTFAELKPQIDAYLARRARLQLIANLRKSAAIELLDEPVAPGPSLNAASPAKE